MRSAVSSAAQCVVQWDEREHSEYNDRSEHSEAQCPHLHFCSGRQLAYPQLALLLAWISHLLLWIWSFSCSFEELALCGWKTMLLAPDSE